MNIDWLHQQLKGIFKDHIWEWIVSFLYAVYNQETGLDLVDKALSINRHFFNICQSADKLTNFKQWSSTQY